MPDPAPPLSSYPHHQDKWLRYEQDIALYYDPRLREWMKKGMPPSQTAFTAGLGRYIASMMEESARAAVPRLLADLEAARKELKWLKKAEPPAKPEAPK